MSLVAALTEAILPVLSIAGVGFLLGRVRDVPVDAIATVTIYVLLPALVFHSLVTTPIGERTAFLLGSGVIVYTLGMLALAGGVGSILGESGATYGGLLLSSSFPNSGNYGIPLAAFAFGAVGRSTAVLYIAFQSVLMYTVGVSIASRGSSTSMKTAVLEIFRLPLIYAVVAAPIVRLLDLVPAEGTPTMEVLRLTGDAAIPVMLLLLGIQLANTTYGSAVRRTTPAVILKLAVSPVLAIGVALALGLDGDIGRVFVLACAMPVAVTPLLLTIKYDAGDEALTGPEYVSTAILLSTIGSVGTLTVLLAALQSGLVF